jgi:hypothetical protein
MYEARSHKNKKLIEGVTEAVRDSAATEDGKDAEGAESAIESEGTGNAKDT